MVEVEVTFGVPDEIIPEVKKEFKSEKDNNLRVTISNPSYPPYYAAGDPRSKHEVMKFKGTEYWVWRVTPGRKK
ncbi:MAG TPA: hypothetical protein VMW26_09200 [Methanomassiliicoccales archaeon]|nr:hypothetical protein [Methanomassiliicoccales archaeon]